MTTPIKRVKFIAMALPLAITVGCGHNSQIIDYTLSNEEYAALTEPAPMLDVPSAAMEEQIASAAQENPVSPQEPAQIVLATAPPKLPELAEPVLAAALPAEPITEAAKSMDSAWTEEPLMAATKPGGMKHKPMHSVTASEMSAEMASSKMNSEVGLESLETTAALEAKVAQLEALANNSISSADSAIISEPVIASALDINRLGFTPSIYATVGLGVSRMNPNTSAAPDFETNDITEPAGQVGLGVDIGKFLSLEAHSADYGSTSLSPSGRINFHVNGVSALIYAGKNLDRFRRRGFNGYARIGYNQIENTTVGDAPFLARTSNVASFGVGAEYTTRWGLGLRADLTAYDGDVQYGQLGILYRLASKPSILPKLAAATDTSAAPQTSNPKPMVVMPAIDTQHTMQDKMQESKQPLLDDALLTAPRYTTENTRRDECTGLNGTLSNVNFMNGSSELTHGARLALDNVANTLMDCAHRQIVVSAHTDSHGSAFENDALSKRRARAVAMHLSTRGVHRDRIRAVAYGESRPIASNSTQDGRTRNRRVELEVR